MTTLRRLIHEIHARSLWQVLAIYLGTSWAVLEAIGVISDAIALPDWVQPVGVILLLIGLPIVLATAFVQEGVAGRSAGLRDRGTGWPHDAAIPGGEAGRADSPAGTPHSAPTHAPSPPVTADYGHSVADQFARSEGLHHQLLTWRNALLGGAAAMLLLAVLTAGYLVTRGLGIGPASTLLAQGVLEERDRILLADFENRTADSLLARTVTEALRVDLAGSDVVRLAEPAFVAEALRRMERPADATLDADLARELAAREGIKAVLAGEVGQAGEAYVLSASLVAPESGEVLATRRESASRSDVIEAIDRLSKHLRERMGESLANLRADPPLERVTTADLEALRQYTQAVRALDYELDFERGIGLLEDAVERDTAFAMAYRKLGQELINRGERRARGLDALRRAYRHRQRLSERERLLATAAYHERVEGDTDAAIRAYEALLDRNPADDWALNNLGVNYSTMRDFRRAEEAYEKAQAIDSTGVFPYTNAAIAEVAQGKLDEAEATLEDLRRTDPHNWMVEGFLSGITLLRGDYDGAEEAAGHVQEDHRDDPFVSAIVEGYRADLAAIRGRLQSAERRKAAEEELQDRRGAAAGALEAALGPVWLDLLVRERPARARERLDAALETHPLEAIPAAERPHAQLVQLWAHAGETQKAREVLDAWDAGLDEDRRRLEAGGFAGARGVLAHVEGRHERAVEDLRRAHDDAEECVICWLPELGRAYDGAGAADSAIAVYERYLKTPWLFRAGYDAAFRGPTLERLAELYDERGDGATAARYYAEFVELWSGADPELQPRVESARRRLQALAQREG
jgi:tetratricopeptide (TPR) repeat protein